ncbi:hypothetical protein ILUMI_01343 [Ignelater luminosus]|uniref:Uncharacterized protein n=1 Tax=Ignelater luminosus TaxID=2038154 RepID=A0A8K0DKB4_IGNLU|nr:hypothetical protein ILUMI_01343 [Ignelater luminosus]
MTGSGSLWLGREHLRNLNLFKEASTWQSATAEDIPIHIMLNLQLDPNRFLEYSIIKVPCAKDELIQQEVLNTFKSLTSRNCDFDPTDIFRRRRKSTCLWYVLYTCEDLTRNGYFQQGNQAKTLKYQLLQSAPANAVIVAYQFYDHQNTNKKIKHPNSHMRLCSNLLLEIEEKLEHEDNISRLQKTAGENIEDRPYDECGTELSNNDNTNNATNEKKLQHNFSINQPEYDNIEEELLKDNETRLTLINQHRSESIKSLKKQAVEMLQQS